MLTRRELQIGQGARRLHQKCHSQKLQEKAAKALRLLDEHQKACKESAEALVGATKAADAALAAATRLELQREAPRQVAALECLHGHEKGRPQAAKRSSEKI